MNHLQVEIHSKQEMGNYHRAPKLNNIHRQLPTERVCCMILSFVFFFFPRAVVFNRRRVKLCLPPQRIVNNVLRYFWSSQFGGGATVIEWVENRNTARHLTQHRTVPPTPPWELYDPNINGSKVKKR